MSIGQVPGVSAWFRDSGGRGYRVKVASLRRKWDRCRVGSARAEVATLT